MRFTYEDVGATRDGRTPPGFTPLGASVKLGDGDACFARAKEALRAWEHFDLGWLRIPPVPIEVGAVAKIRLFRFLPMGRCGIVWVRDEARRFEFAYGTLAGHPESGEERFSVIHRDDGSVWYEVQSFSRFRLPVGGLIARFFQRKFLQDSCKRMVEGNRE